MILNLSFTRGGGGGPDAKQPKEIRPCFGFVRRAAREPLQQQHGVGRSEQDKVRGKENVAFLRPLPRD